MHANRQNTAQKFQLMQETWAPLFWPEIRVAAKKSLRIIHQHYWWVGSRRSSWFTGLRWGLHCMFWLNAAQDLWQVVFLPATCGDVGPYSISTICGKTKFHALISQQYLNISYRFLFQGNPNSSRFASCFSTLPSSNCTTFSTYNSSTLFTASCPLA